MSSLDGSLAPEVSSALIRRETADRRAEQPGKPVVRYVLVMGNHRPIMPATELPPIPNVYIGGRVHFVHGGRVVSGGGGGGFIEPRPVLTPLPPRTPHAALNRVIDPPRPDWTSRFTGLPDGVKEFAAAVESPWMDAPPLSAALSDLHDRSGLDIVSDSFVRVRSPGIARYAKVRLGEYLDKICERLHYAWTVQHDTLQLRSGLYYLDRAREVPPSEIDRLRQELKAPAGSQLQTLAHASLRLTPEQVRGLADHWPWYLQDDEVWLPAPDNDASLWSGFAGVLAVLGSLDAASRAQALSGQVVPMPRSLVALTRLQAQLVADPFENGDVPSIAEMATASVTARTMEQQNVLYEVDGPDGRRGPLTDVRDAGWRPPLGMQGFSYRLLAPPLPIQRITVEIRRSGPDGPSDLTSGVFLLSSPVRRSVIPEMGR